MRVWGHQVGLGVDFIHSANVRYASEWSLLHRVTPEVYLKNYFIIIYYLYLYLFRVANFNWVRFNFFHIFFMRIIVLNVGFVS